MQFDPSDIQRDDNEPFRVLDDDGYVVEENRVPSLPDEDLVKLYREMVFARHFDNRAISLQRQGRLGTYPPLAGHEAAQIASTFALNDEDWIFPTYRENAIPFVRGVDAEKVIEYWRGYEESNVALTDANIFPFNIVVGGLIPHATGKAMAFGQDENDERIAVCHFGDGASSEGDFHEGLNFAGVFDAPCIFFCNNNQWAISVPRERQTASQTIAQKALAYGFRGVQIDGMDPLAVYAVTDAAATEARSPGKEETRPTLIESVQYRLRQHTTADDPSVYRDDVETERWRQKDPIDRMAQFLLNTGRLDGEGIDSIEHDCEERVAEAIDAAAVEADAEPDPIFDHTYQEPTNRIEEQKQWLTDFRRRHGEERVQE